MTAIPFTRGVPSADMLPIDDLERAATAALREDGAGALAYRPGGYPPLREWIGARHGVPDELRARLQPVEQLAAIAAGNT